MKKKVTYINKTAAFASIIALTVFITTACTIRHTPPPPAENNSDSIAVDAALYSWVWAKANYYSQIKTADQTTGCFNANITSRGRWQDRMHKAP